MPLHSPAGRQVQSLFYRGTSVVDFYVTSTECSFPWPPERRAAIQNRCVGATAFPEWAPAARRRKPAVREKLTAYAKIVERKTDLSAATRGASFAAKRPGVESQPGAQAISGIQLL